MKKKLTDQEIYDIIEGVRENIYENEIMFVHAADIKYLRDIIKIANHVNGLDIAVANKPDPLWEGKKRYVKSYKLDSEHPFEIPEGAHTMLIYQFYQNTADADYFILRCEFIKEESKEENTLSLSDVKYNGEIKSGDYVIYQEPARPDPERSDMDSIIITLVRVEHINMGGETFKAIDKEGELPLYRIRNIVKT